MADWKHGWIPITPKAIRQKNHGRTPGPDSKLGQQMDNAIRAKAAQRTGRGRSTGGPSPSDDIDAAARAIRSGDNARAINLMTRAMNNTKDPKERAAIKKQRDALARKAMGR